MGVLLSKFVAWATESDLQFRPFLCVWIYRAIVYSTSPLKHFKWLLNSTHLTLNLGLSLWIWLSSCVIAMDDPSPSQSLQPETRSCLWHVSLYHLPLPHHIQLIMKSCICYLLNVSQISKLYLSLSLLSLNLLSSSYFHPCSFTFNYLHSIQKDLFIIQLWYVTPVFIPFNCFPSLLRQKPNVELGL